MTGVGFSLFVACAIFALLGAIITIAAKNPLRAAMGLLTHIVALSGLYLTLHAPMLAAIQLLVYAGAVVVLFVFVIMLIGPEPGKASKSDGQLAKVISASLVGIATLLIAFAVLHVSGAGAWVEVPETYGTVEGLGGDIYTKALLPFELISITLTVAVIGAIAVAKGRSKEEAEKAREVRADVLRIRAEQEGAASPAE